MVWKQKSNMCNQHQRRYHNNMRLAHKTRDSNSISIDFVCCLILFVNIESLKFAYSKQFYRWSKPNKWPKMHPKSGLNAKLYRLLYGLMRAAMLILAMNGTYRCVYMWHAYETFQIAAGWSNICFKDVLQATPLRTNRPISPKQFHKTTKSEWMLFCLLAYTSSQILLLAKNVWVSFSFWLGESFIENAVRPKNHRERKRNVWAFKSTNGKMF